MISLIAQNHDVNLVFMLILWTIHQRVKQNKTFSCIIISRIYRSNPNTWYVMMSCNPSLTRFHWIRRTGGCLTITYNRDWWLFPVICLYSRRVPRYCPDSKFHGANMGPIWGRQDPGGPHAGPMNFAIWVCEVAPVWSFRTQVATHTHSHTNYI